MNPSRISDASTPLARPISRTRASFGPLDSTRWATAADISTTMRVNDGYDRTRRSSRVTSAGAAAVRKDAGPDTGVARTGALATSVGRTRSTKDSGTSHTPRLTRTGASSTTGLPLTSTRDQLRVRVTTLSPARRWARVLVAVASTFV